MEDERPFLRHHRVSFVLYVIYDLDNPFAGDWQISSEPIRLLLEQIERDRAAPTK